MKAAVAGYHDQVSPRLERSTHLVLVDVRDGHVLSEQRIEAHNFTPEGLAELLQAEGVTQLVCGGILRLHQQVLEQRGIEVIWGVIGRTVDAIIALAADTLTSDQFVGRGHESV